MRFPNTATLALITNTPEQIDAVRAHVTATCPDADLILSILGIDTEEQQ